MKILAPARELAGAFGLAASLAASADDRRARKIPAFEATCLIANNGSAVTISSNVLDFALTLTVPVGAVEAPGSVAIPGQRLAALAAGFPNDASVAIATDGTMATVSCGRSRFRLPTIPLNEMPEPLALAEETGRIELTRADAIKALGTPLVAAGSELSRFYLTGIYLHAVDGALAAVATDGKRLVRVLFPGIDGLVVGLIMPRPVIKIILKLLADKTIERVTLRQSATCARSRGRASRLSRN